MDIKDFTLKVSYKIDGKVVTVSSGDDVLSFSDEGGADCVRLKVKATRPVELVLAELIYEEYYEQDEFFFANGFQSWTTSREYRKGDRQFGLRNLSNFGIARKFAAPTGDYDFTEYGKELFHSHTYTYLRRGDRLEFVGSLNERTGYTVFYADMREQVFAVDKDVEGLIVSGEYEMFNVVYFEGGYDEVFDLYFGVYPEKHTGRVSRLAGYTSWYNYFQNIDENIILRDLEGLAQKAGSAADIFQIDDGFESMVGDWLEIDKRKFPHGMKYIADKIHEKGYKAGLWLAPFSAQFKSRVVREHPEWLLKNSEGGNLIGGFAWNGFYVLDIGIPEVREYIEKVFKTVFDDWGFDMVKLDFLYSEAILPHDGKTRGTLMCEAMDFLRKCCSDKLILGCGVPLGPAFGKVDACRISCDVELSFKEKYYTRCTNQEIISARQAINNSVFRRHLDGRIFANDPDVFFLRSGGAKKPRFNAVQKKLLARINRMFGSVLFMSDNAAEYNEGKTALLLETYKRFEGKVVSAQYIDQDNIEILYDENGLTQRLVLNLLTGEHSVEAVK